MCEQTEINYLDGEIVWVKLGSCWWPGEVVALEKLPPDELPSFRKPPIACVKFFQEDAYEYVKSINNIYKYNCSRKHEFINKGLYMFRTKHGHMEKFPEDIIRAETAIGGDVEILTREEFQETKKESYAGLFGDPKKTPSSLKKGKAGKGRTSVENLNVFTPRRQMREKADYKVHILLQGSTSKPIHESTTAEVVPATTSSTDVTDPEEKPQTENTSQNEDTQNDAHGADNKETPNTTIPQPSTPLNTSLPSTASPSTALSSSGIYACHACPFTTSRLNVLILHNKTHSVSFIPYTPSPVKKKLISPPKTITNNSCKTPKPRKPRKEKINTPPKKVQTKKRASEENMHENDVKKPKTDEEIKSSLLADWDDDVDDDSNDESSAMMSAQSPEVPVGAESPAVPTPAELPSAQVPTEMSPVPDKKSSSTPSTEKPESSKYEFCEDEDWPEETDFGRKIPRVKNPLRTEDSKTMNIDEDDVAREVAELLNKTAVPELPSVPEPLKIEENFPELSIVKSPDKNTSKSPEKIIEESVIEVPQTKAIFKTKTFFRSRHCRSQDVIGKYVAEQLNAVERMDISENEINGSEVVSSPEARDSPPIEPVKTTRLAPKIQLKKMKAEAAQLREKEKLNTDQVSETFSYDQISNNAVSDGVKSNVSKTCNKGLTVERNDEDDSNNKLVSFPKLAHDVLYPTQEIKPLNAEAYPAFTTDRFQEQCTKKQSFIEHNIAEFITETSKHEEVIHAYKFKEKILRLHEHTPKQEESSLTHEQESFKHDEISSVHQESSNAFNSSRPIENTIKLKDNEIETSRNGKANLVNIKDISLHKEEPVRLKSDAIMPTLDSTMLEVDANHDGNKPVSKEETLKANDTVSSQNVDMEMPKYEEKLVQTTKFDNEIKIEDNRLPQLPNDNGKHEIILFKQESVLHEKQVPIAKLPEPTLLDSEIHLPKPLTNEQSSPYMNESTASAVDALLSVSREVDRVPRVVTNDLPEDLFEDDNKDTDNVESTNFNEEMDNKNLFTGNGHVEKVALEETHNVENTQDVADQINSNIVETSEVFHAEEIVETSKPIIDQGVNIEQSVVENVPTESDLQIAEALINLPSTAIPNKTSTEHKDSLLMPFSFENNEKETVSSTDAEKEIISETISHLEQPIAESDLSTRFETEQEKSENLNAAQSLVQMSESIEHKVNIVEPMDIVEPVVMNKNHNNIIDTSTNSREHNAALLSSEISSPAAKSKPFEQSSSKLLKMLEEPCKPKTGINKPTPTKQIIMQSKEKILNFDVAKSTFKNKSPKQKIIIRRTGNPSKTVLNSANDITNPDKIILSRSGNSSQEGSSMQTFTIKTSPDTPSDANTIIIQQKIRKITQPTIIQPKLQKIKSQPSLVSPTPPTEMKGLNKLQTNDDAMFDINSMPIVLSEDLLTPESIEKMPVVMSDASILNQSHITNKAIKPKQKTIEHEKVTISSAPHKSEVKTLLLNPGGEVTKSITPNILSKSTKLRGAKPMLVIDKATGKQKIIMTKAEQPIKEAKHVPTIIQPATTIIQPATQTSKTEKFIILPSQSSSPRPTRTQKIVIDPQTGKAHVFVAKGSDAPLNTTDNKPVSAKLIPSNNDATTPGNTVMIITNAQGAQSRIVLTPEHEKILFPNKQQPNVSQLKTIAHRITTTTSAPKTIMTTMAPVKTPTIAPVKPPTRIVPKQKSAIITSKGQLIVGGRVATTAQNIAPMPDMRTVSKRITSEPKKIVTQPVQKSNSEPIIFLQQKSGAVMQLTAAQFEHLQRTGQIVQKTGPPVQEKIIIQKVKPANEPGPSIKSRARKIATDPPAPSKRIKHEIAIAPAPAPPTLVPALAPATRINPPVLVPTPSNTVSVVSTGYSNFDNFEELLPSTAIARQLEPPAPAPEPAPAPLPPPPPPQEQTPAPAQLTDGQLLAVPGEHFGGPAGTFYLCVEDNGTFTPIDNRPLVLENNQLVPMQVEVAVPERRDILEAALANSDVFRAETPRDDAPDFRDLNANVSVHCRVSETSSTLNQPIMTPLEMPSKAAAEPAVPASLEDGLAVIGVTPHAVPTSLELPITVTDPRIAPRMSDPLGGGEYGARGLVSPGAGADVYAGVAAAGPISMPLLTEEDEVGKSMPILCDETAPSSLGSAGSEEEGWARRLLTPSSEVSETSSEIPLQPALRLSPAEIDHS